jgi:hypothetical protein
MRAPLLLFVLATLVTGCVSVRTLDRDQLPAAWRTALPASAAGFRDPSGVYASPGKAALASGGQEDKSLADALFPGHRMNATRYRLSWDRQGSTLTAVALDGPLAGRRRTFDAQVCPQDGGLFLAEVPVRGSSFGPDATSQSVWLRVGDDGALYIEVSASSVGVSGIVPYAGHHHSWGRWEKVEPAPPAAGVSGS